jgi:hypothetical protein
VDRDRLLLGLAAVFAGMTVLLVVLALAVQPFLLVLALPFGATTYFLWYHASGRLRERMRGRQRRQRRQRRRGPAAGGPFGPGQGRAAGPGPGAGRGPRGDGPSPAEAYRTLGLDPGADEATVREAYRERVKEVHPDRGGSEDEFKRVTRAYEALRSQ